jgi:hypothetical protein
MNLPPRFGVPLGLPLEIASSGQIGVKLGEIYVFRSVTGRALNPNNGR